MFNLDPQIAKLTITLAVLAAVIFSLTFLRAAPDLVLLGGLTLLLVSGVLDAGQALAGFANEGLVTVAVLFVVAEGLRQTGAISYLAQKLLGRPKGVSSAQARIAVPVAVMSAFLNNTPVVAMAMPIIDDWAKKFRLSVSHLLMPLSFAAILGGMCTLVGTSTTLVVNGLLIEEQGPQGLGLGMFEIAWVGLPIAAAGLLYMLLFTRLLLPERKPAMAQLDDPREYTVEMLVAPHSPLVGQTIEQAGLRHLPSMYLMEIDRNGHVLPAVPSNERLLANDRLVFVGVVESVVDLQKIPGLTPATDQLFKLEGPRSERCMIEAVVSNSYPFLRMTIREARFRSHYNAAVIAVARNGQRVRGKIGDIELLPGDTLLLEASPAFIDMQRNSRDFFLVSRVENSTPPRHELAWIARTILIAMVAVVAVGWVSILKAAMLAAGLMIVTGCCRGAEARRSIDWSVLLVIGAGLGIGRAMQESGAALLLAEGLIGLGGSNPQTALILVFGATLVLTNVITNNAAAVLVFPIAVATARELQVDYMPFVIVLAIAASTSFASPIGYQTNLMVYGPGGYRFGDYLRIGGPLSILAGAIAIAVTPLVWPF